MAILAGMKDLLEACGVFSRVAHFRIDTCPMYSRSPPVLMIWKVQRNA